MRRTIALVTATAAWVLVIQVASIAMAPPVVVELSPVDVAQEAGTTESQESLAATLPLANAQIIVVPGAILSPTTTTQDFSSVTTTPRTTTTNVTVTTTGPATTTTAAPVTTTTKAPTTTAPPATTTTAAPVTTTTTAAATTTTAPATTTTAASTGSYSASAESEFLSSINGLRSSKGLAGLASNGELNNYARWWAKQMADTGNFAHSNIASLLNPWTVVGENIGYGPSVSAVFNALVASPGHYANMVDTRFTSVGVGAYVDSAGRIWTVHVFGG